MHDPIIIIGAGFAGLNAARELSAAGLSTILLEAGPRAGGRALTLQAEGFSSPVETGAEFIHGHLPLSLQLLKEAGIPHHPVAGKMVRVRKGEWLKEEMFTEGWEELLHRMQQLTEDQTVADFLDTWFSGDRYAGLRDLVRRYAEGYDLVDLHTASVLALYREWQQEEAGEQYRIVGGYSRLAGYLVTECREKGCLFHFSSPVAAILWEKGKVQVQMTGGKTFTGSKVILTVPVSVLRAAPSDPIRAQPLAGDSPASQSPSHPAQPDPVHAYGSSAYPSSANPSSASPPGIRFSPALEEYRQAASQLGYGAVTKILLEFREAFWNKKDKNIGFILSDEAVPTWWTQLPDKRPLLTGWVAGTALKALHGLDEKAILDRCLSSLAAIFSLEKKALEEALLASKIMDWSKAPFIHGGYSFDTVRSADARRLLRRPVEDTLFFGGEALYEGPSPGTVEAALTSGKELAEMIIAQS